ncbi:hypothetical protein F414_gp10 [Cronobacter phage ESP2949-1]|uniref:Uncharacterized protein n=1 Tax=Cronobacter phage ESP2949-1 TaxID=2920894 RepID=G1CSQ7_9CAUD|nr:hypothetical protein F414_gp10 [Cronobacter phage ESP2949-1]AEM24805.1 hypothetical protein [Cronobacter phage ESP2949-1]
MNYDQIRAMASAGIDFFSDGDGNFKCITQQGGVKMVGGVEVPVAEQSVTIHGLIRSPKIREVDGEQIMVTDKLGIFNADVEIKKGYRIVVDGETYTVTEPRPVRQTGTTVAYRPILRRIAVGG